MLPGPQQHLWPQQLISNPAGFPPHFGCMFHSHPFHSKSCRNAILDFSGFSSTPSPELFTDPISPKLRILGVVGTIGQPGLTGFALQEYQSHHAGLFLLNFTANWKTQVFEQPSTCRRAKVTLPASGKRISRRSGSGMELGRQVH